VYVSPDGRSEQPASTPARAVQLRFAGWRLKSEPRKKTGTDPVRSKKPADNPDD
jgi:hypothetical protein